MSYVAFALKYRPQTFSEVLSQRHVVGALTDAILKNRVHHAYLFSGPRGVGKTSLARILAKSLNCEKGPTPAPCGVCTSCGEIIRGTALDIVEIDGASNRGIDEIRVVRENVKLFPAYSRYKIYIIDEVHMLTPEAFNALLKTLEEPPAHVKFIFATTHPHKVLPTILSRCQRFSFNLVSLEEIVAKLKRIAQAEGVTVPESLFYAIGRAAAGSIRDAESLLDQLVPVILEHGQVEDVLSFLGIIDEESLNTMLNHIVAKDLSSSLDFIDKVVKEGKDLGVFLVALLEHLRVFLLAKVSAKTFGRLMDVSPQSKEVIVELSGRTSAAEILKLIDLLIQAKDLAHKLNTVRIPLELAIVKFTYQETEEDLVYKQSQVQAAAPKALKEESSLPPAGAANDLDAQIDSLDFDTREQADFDIEESEDDGANDGILCQAVTAKWKVILSAMQKVRAAIAAHLAFAQPVSSQGKVVRIAFARKSSFHKEVVEAAKNVRFIEETISKFVDKAVGIKFVFCEPAGAAAAAAAAGPGEAAETQINSQESAQDDQFLNDLLDNFGGKIQSE